jgi:hypothetical protein
MLPLPIPESILFMLQLSSGGKPTLALDFRKQRGNLERWANHFEAPIGTMTAESYLYFNAYSDWNGWHLHLRGHENLASEEEPLAEVVVDQLQQIAGQETGAAKLARRLGVER